MTHCPSQFHKCLSLELTPDVAWIWRRQAPEQKSTTSLADERQLPTQKSTEKTHSSSKCAVGQQFWQTLVETGDNMRSCWETDWIWSHLLAWGRTWSSQSLLHQDDHHPEISHEQGKELSVAGEDILVAWGVSCLIFSVISARASLCSICRPFYVPLTAQYRTTPLVGWLGGLLYYSEDGPHYQALVWQVQFKYRSCLV